MVIPVMATIIPLYQMFAAGKMLDDIFWLSMVYVSSYLPMAVWLISNYFATIPEELEEAALIDGCGKFVSFLPHHPAAFLSDYFVCDFDHVFKYVESVSDPADPCLLDGDKTDGDRGV